MANDILGQILGSVLGNARGGGQMGGGLGGGLGGGGLGDLLGSVLGRGTDSMGGGGMGGFGRSGGSGMGGKGALLAMLLPIAMQWVQRNGGIGAVLGRLQQKGYSQQAASWVSTGDNEELAPEAIHDIVGMEELSRLSQQLGVSHEEISSGMAQILPQMVNQLTPDGTLPDDGDDTLERGRIMLEEFMNAAR